MAFHHVQLACPPGSEDTLRAFYIGVLGMTEKPKPPALAVPDRTPGGSGKPSPAGGCWFFDEYAAELHLGVETDFHPARKAHPAFARPDLDALAAKLEAAGYPVTWGNDEVPGMRRFHSEDCLCIDSTCQEAGRRLPHCTGGNRLEFVQIIE